MTTSRSWVGMVSLLCAFALAGSRVVAAKYLGDQLGVFTVAAISMAFGLLVLAPLCGARLLRALRTLTRGAWRALFAQALLGMFLSRLFMLFGVRGTSALEAGILSGITPALTSVLAWALLRERVARRALIGIVLTVAGVLLVQGLGSGGQLLRAHLIGNLLIVAAAASESAFNIASRAAIQRGRAADAMPDTVVQAFVVTAMALLMCLIPALWEQPLQRLALIQPQAWLALLWMGVFVTALAYLGWYAGIRRTGAIAAAAYSGMMPLTAMVLSTSLLGEAATVAQWLGGGLVILGMAAIGIGGAPMRRRPARVAGGQ